MTKLPTIDLKKNNFIQKDRSTLYQKNDYNIILIFGESLRYDRFNFHLEKNFISYKTISLATATDVVLPLFLTTSKTQKEINIDNSLFNLAKKADFKTYFITTQTKNAMRYIKEFISFDSIDYYKEAKKGEFDYFLVDKIKKINFDKKLFLVMQFYGQHSPYDRYPTSFKKFTKNDSMRDKVNSNYNNSVLFSNHILNQLINHIQRVSKKPTFIIFTSDHGEFLGENKRYGHNSFQKEIYLVPSFIHSINSKLSLKSRPIISHIDLSNYIRFLLGYEKEFNFSDEKIIRVNGTMMSGEDGFLDVNIYMVLQNIS